MPVLPGTCGIHFNEPGQLSCRLNVLTKMPKTEFINIVFYAEFTKISPGG